MTKPSPVPEPPLVVKNGAKKICGYASDGIRNAAAVVGNLNEEKLAVAARADLDATRATHGINRIVNEVRPNLVQLAPVGAEPRQCAVKNRA